MTHKNSGFTLIELLVGMIIATLVITPLLTFLLNIMNTDRKEQAKATSEQEIQSAIDYIAQDLEQAVYIYDADALNNNSTTNTATSGIKDQIPPIASAPGCESSTSTCVPVLVFWKRELSQGIVPVSGSTTNKNDTFVYSLVAYYLIKGNNANEHWSDAARIGRFQIRDGVRNPANLSNIVGGNYIEAPSNGFQPFNLSLTGVTLKDKMNRWQKTNQDYTEKILTLVDFIDKSPTGIAASCPTNTQQVPATLVGGFYACVDSSRTSAEIYIRGTALARINQSASCDSQPTYCPSASIQIKGRGLLGAD